MADVTSREKVVYWIVIAIVVLGGLGALAYFFINSQKSGTSLADVSSKNDNAIAPYSLIDIVTDNNSTGISNSGSPQSPVSNITNRTNQVPVPVGNRINQVPVPPTNNPTNQVPVPPTNRVNQVLSAEPLNTGNDFLNRPVVSANGASTSLSSGSGLPTNSPVTGPEDVLLLSGIASLGVSGIATALALRKPRGRSRKTRS